METVLADVSEDELYHRIGRSLLLSLPDGWQGVTYCFEIIDDDVWEESAVVNTGNQQEKSISLRPSGDGMLNTLIELVRRMEKAGHGRWQKALFSMTSNGKFSIDYDYEDH